MLDPHAFRALQNFYPRFGAWYPVEHYTTFLAERLEQLKPLMVRSLEADGHVPRQLLRGPAVRLLRSAAVAAAAHPGLEAGGNGPQPRQRLVLRGRGRRHVAGRPYRRPGRPATVRRRASGRRPPPAQTRWRSPALTSCRASKTPPRSRAWRAASRSATSSNSWPKRMDLGERSV